MNKLIILKGSDNNIGSGISLFGLDVVVIFYCAILSNLILLVLV